MTFREAYVFQRPDLLEVALTHKSKAFEGKQASQSASELPEHNEKLEFLGDAVLGLALADLLMARFRFEAEGALSKKRAALVNEDKLSELAVRHGLDREIRLGKGELKTGGAQKPRILACGFEAWLGAVFLDGGYQAARTLIESLFQDDLNKLEQSGADYNEDFKTRLQERTQASLGGVPLYRVVDESGPAHERLFAVEVEIEWPSGHAKAGSPSIRAKGWGRSKKAAEQNAAEQALAVLQTQAEGESK